jgi:hypothetical protein
MNKLFFEQHASKLNRKEQTVKVFDNEYKYIIYNYKPEHKYDSDVNHIRSVITDEENNILSYSTEKSTIKYNVLQGDEDNEDNELIDIDAKNIQIEEFVEGTMIMMFYDNRITYTENGEECKGKWQIATRSNVGANATFFVSDNLHTTFSEMFYNTLNTLNININDFISKIYNCETKESHKICYHFVMQHPNNKIVNYFAEPKLYLINTFVIEEEESNYKITKIHGNEITNNSIGLDLNNITNISYPYIYNKDELESSNINNYNNLYHFVSNIKNKKAMGVVIYNKSRKIHMKIRSQLYETIHMLRGNQPRLPFRYLELKKDKKIGAYLYNFPEHKEVFNEYHNKIKQYTKEIYSTYVSTYMTKKTNYDMLSSDIKKHMYHIHKYYKDELKKNRAIHIGDVINYVNNLDPKITMSCLFSKKTTKKVESDNKEVLNC